MNEAKLFACWLDQGQPSKLTLGDIHRMSVVDVTTKMNASDLIAIMYHGRGSVAICALNCLKEKFEAEMHYLESITYTQEPA